MIFTDEHNKILDAALNTFGSAEQMSMAIGECGEFLLLEGRKVQNRVTPEMYMTEIADVIIMMEQMARMFGYDEVMKIRNEKLKRLKNKIDSYIPPIGTTSTINLTSHTSNNNCFSGVDFSWTGDPDDWPRT